MVRCFGVCLWSRANTSFSPVPLLMLSGKWSANDYDVLAEGAVIGRISLAPDPSKKRRWLWTLAHGQHKDRGYERTRKRARAGAMAAFANMAAGVGHDRTAFNREGNAAVSRTCPRT
jgi:hypothetical protein